MENKFNIDIIDMENKVVVEYKKHNPTTPDPQLLTELLDKIIPYPHRGEYRKGMTDEERAAFNDAEDEWIRVYSIRQRIAYLCGVKQRFRSLRGDVYYMYSEFSD